MTYALTHQHRDRLHARFVLLAAAVAVVLAVVTVVTIGGLLAAAASVFAVAIIIPAVWLYDRAAIGFELRVLTTFRAVCRASGLAAKQPRGAGFIYPPAGRLSGTPEAFSLTVRPLPGQALKDWENAAPALALAFHVTSVRVSHGDGGRLVLSVGYARMPSHDFQPRSAVPAGVSWRDTLRAVEVGRGQDGSPFLLPVIDSHVLVAGTTGAGKGSVIWSLLLGLLPGYDAGVVRFWALDPKRMELALGRQVFGDHYAADQASIVSLLETAVSEMYQRADRLAGRTRKFEPSTDTPLEVIVIDELGVMASTLTDRKQKQAFDSALTTLLALGRAVGFMVIGAVQDPRKETLDARDLFPVRVAMRLPKPMVDLVLGTGMYAAGAQCDLIPHGTDGAGVAFVVDESSTLPRCVRMSWCSDDVIISETTNRRLAAPNPTVRLDAVTA